MVTLLIKAESEAGETFTIPFLSPRRISEAQLVSDCKAILWDARWIPGSVAWRVFKPRPRPLADLPLAVGENY